MTEVWVNFICLASTIQRALFFWLSWSLMKSVAWCSWDNRHNESPLCSYHKFSNIITKFLHQNWNTEVEWPMPCTVHTSTENRPSCNFNCFNASRNIYVPHTQYNRRCHRCYGSVHVFLCGPVRIMWVCLLLCGNLGTFGSEQPHCGVWYPSSEGGGITPAILLSLAGHVPHHDDIHYTVCPLTVTPPHPTKILSYCRPCIKCVVSKYKVSEKAGSAKCDVTTLITTPIHAALWLTIYD